MQVPTYMFSATNVRFLPHREDQLLHLHLSRCQVCLQTAPIISIKSVDFLVCYLIYMLLDNPRTLLLLYEDCFLVLLQDPTCCPATTAWGVLSYPTQTFAHPPSSSLLMSILPLSRPLWAATPPSLTATTQKPLVTTAAPPPSPALEVPSCPRQPFPPSCLLSAENQHIYFW